MEKPTGHSRCDHLQPQPSEAAWEEAEVTSRYATEAELEALGYKGPVLVTQVIRTAFRADGTPVGKTLTLQGGSTALVVHRDPKSVEDEEAYMASGEPAAPVPQGPVSRPVRTYLVGVEGSPQTKIGRTTGALKSRVSQLQTSHHARLLPLLDVEGDYERALHERFAHYRVRGEWFDLTPLGDPVTVVIAALAELGLNIRSGLGLGLPEVEKGIAYLDR
ncbi:GIY-YIG nuclease family protein [Streptomyces sp. H27-H1]|uniref:GIY-YIG nuclease family protein n=1 Tax=Streptomyces sp. H27-H1 TaxID=2996461 RepID=UPI00226DBD8D|nr:GIY-YIG nuclease family protein [Streptomyces sp. H27-H1]MCY0930895.1 GIY-YIG nuclease family protein [Streptomyces sp. H27-H1]